MRSRSVRFVGPDRGKPSAKSALPKNCERENLQFSAWSSGTSFSWQGNLGGMLKNGNRVRRWLLCGCGRRGGLRYCVRRANGDGSEGSSSKPKAEREAERRWSTVKACPQMWFSLERQHHSHRRRTIAHLSLCLRENPQRSAAGGWTCGQKMACYRTIELRSPRRTRSARRMVLAICPTATSVVQLPAITKLDWDDRELRKNHGCATSEHGRNSV